MSDTVAELKAQNAKLRKALADATRTEQQRDWEGLAKAMKPGAIVSIPEGEPDAGHYQKQGTKLVKLATIAGVPVFDGQRGHGRGVMVGSNIKAAADADPDVAAMRKRLADARKPYVKESK
jgi:hypothetical protein